MAYTHSGNLLFDYYYYHFWLARFVDTWSTHTKHTLSALEAECCWYYRVAPLTRHHEDIIGPKTFYLDGSPCLPTKERGEPCVIIELWAQLRTRCGLRSAQRCDIARKLLYVCCCCNNRLRSQASLNDSIYDHYANRTRSSVSANESIQASQLDNNRVNWQHFDLLMIGAACHNCNLWSIMCVGFARFPDDDCVWSSALICVTPWESEGLIDSNQLTTGLPSDSVCNKLIKILTLWGFDILCSGTSGQKVDWEARCQKFFCRSWVIDFD